MKKRIPPFSSLFLFFFSFFSFILISAGPFFDSSKKHARSWAPSFSSSSSYLIVPFFVRSPASFCFCYYNFNYASLCFATLAQKPKSARVYTECNPALHFVLLLQFYSIGPLFTSFLDSCDPANNPSFHSCLRIKCPQWWLGQSVVRGKNVRMCLSLHSWTWAVRHREVGFLSFSLSLFDRLVIEINCDEFARSNDAADRREGDNIAPSSGVNELLPTGFPDRNGIGRKAPFGFCSIGSLMPVESLNWICDIWRSCLLYRAIGIGCAENTRTLTHSTSTSSRTSKKLKSRQKRGAKRLRKGSKCDRATYTLLRRERRMPKRVNVLLGHIFNHFMPTERAILTTWFVTLDS